MSNGEQSRSDKSESVRQQLLRRFQFQLSVNEPDADVATALYAILWALEDVTVDGWALFRVVRESHDSLEGVGLMTLLPTGSVPMSVEIRAHEHELVWSARAGLQDQQWLALSNSKRWNAVYLFATGGREEAQWTWDREYQGVLAARPDR